MNSTELNLQVLSKSEQEEITGGILPVILGCLAVIGASYAAGQAFGDALWYYNHRP